MKSNETIKADEKPQDELNKNYGNVSKTLDQLIEGLRLYKDEAWQRLCSSKGKVDLLTGKKYHLSNELWANLSEIRSELTEKNVNETIQAIKFLYGKAHQDHEKILNEITSYYFLRGVFKSLGFFWGTLGKQLDLGIDLVNQKPAPAVQTVPDQKSPVSDGTKFQNIQKTLNELIQGLFIYKELSSTRMNEMKTPDSLTLQKYELSKNLWIKLIELQKKLTMENMDDVLDTIKLAYLDAHKQHAKILQDILTTTCNKIFPKRLSHFFESNLTTFFDYLGSFWSGTLGKELNKTDEAKLTQLQVSNQKLPEPEVDAEVPKAGM